ncbi:MAG TPA: dihydropteroate synthase [bacterium]|nr:dihydropteroate synthase [bacterium]
MEIFEINPRTPEDAAVELLRLGAQGEGAAGSRLLFQALLVRGASPADALALKEEMSAAGGDATLPLSVYQGGGDGAVDVILTGALDSHRRCATAIASRSRALESVAASMNRLISRLDGSAPTPPALWPDGPMPFGSRTYVMGIINATPDSFYDGGRNIDVGAAIKTVADMADAGVDIVDVGGESTRPGSAPVGEEEEIRRVLPLIKEIRASFPALRISIDTYRARTADAALAAGAGMINDISAMRIDPDIARVAAEFGAPLCLMHMRGEPRNMQLNPSYPGDVCFEINTFFSERIRAALDAGVKESQIVIDPGIGFGKTAEHNLEILNRLDEFRPHGRPILIGASRKSFIGAALDLPVEERLEGSLAAAALSVARGADIVRVHDVRATVRAVRLADAVVRKKRMLERND